MKKLILAIVLLFLVPTVSLAGDCTAHFTFTWEGRIDTGNKIVITGLEDKPVVRSITVLDPEKEGNVHKYQVDNYNPCSLSDGSYKITAHIVNSWGVKGVESQVFPIEKDTTTPKPVSDLVVNIELY